MTDWRETQMPMASVLDRLLDEEPDVSREPARSRNQALRELRQAVRRDLEYLLNTRHSYLRWAPALKEVDQSVLNYGLSDITGSGLSSAKDREEFCRTLQGILRRYEPRFKTVTVRLLENAAALDRTLRFRIDALLRVDPAPEPIVFDSMLEPSNSAFVVKGVG
jgi:type VI secretion system protein ImpF